MSTTTLQQEDLFPDESFVIETPAFSHLWSSVLAFDLQNIQIDHVCISGQFFVSTAADEVILGISQNKIPWQGGNQEDAITIRLTAEMNDNCWIRSRMYTVFEDVYAEPVRLNKWNTMHVKICKIGKHKMQLQVALNNSQMVHVTEVLEVQFAMPWCGYVGLMGYRPQNDAKWRNMVVEHVSIFIDVPMVMIRKCDKLCNVKFEF